MAKREYFSVRVSHPARWEYKGVTVETCSNLGRAMTYDTLSFAGDILCS